MIPSPLSTEPLPSWQVSYKNYHYIGNIDRPNIWVVVTVPFFSVKTFIGTLILIIETKRANEKNNKD